MSLVVDGLHKRFGDVVALGGISFSRAPFVPMSQQLYPRSSGDDR